jgi:hypothetical protein
MITLPSIPPLPLGSIIKVCQELTKLAPVIVILPLVNAVVATILAPVTLPDKLALVPVITPPTVEAAVAVPVTDTELPVIAPPTTDAEVTVPVTLTVVPV